MYPGSKSSTFVAMTEWLILLLLVPAVVVPAVLLVGFAGCSFHGSGTFPSAVLVSAVGKSESEITLTWTGPGIAGVTFEYERTKGDGSPTILPAVSSPHDDPGLDPATSYDYRVRTIYADGPDPVWSNMVTGTTLSSTAVTKSLICTAASSQALTRSWDAGGSRTQWTFST